MAEKVDNNILMKYIREEINSYLDFDTVFGYTIEKSIEPLCLQTVTITIKMHKTNEMKI